MLRLTGRPYPGLQPLFRSLKGSSTLLLVLAALFSTVALCSAHTPFTGTPIAIPGMFNAVDYDKGTLGDAYNIQQPSPSGLYRADDANGPVPINSINQYGTATGTVVGGNGFVLGNHVVQGDWLVYTVNVATTGYYDIQVNAAPAQAGRQIDFQLDGADVTPGNITLAYTTSWGNFGVATYPAAHLTSGTHTLKMLIADVNATFILNTFTFSPHVVHNYFVSSSTGSDSNPGTQAAPFATVAKAESQTLNAGDSVFFYRGDTWRESLNPICNGAAGNPITFADYGPAANAKPKFLGSNLIPVNDGQWTSQGGNVYTHACPQQATSVLVNQQFLIDIFIGGTSSDESVFRDPSNTPNCWKWSGGVLTISTNGTNPNTDGRAYEACVREDVICNGSQTTSYGSNLVFRNLVADESACNCNDSQKNAYGNGILGYGVRIEGNGVTTGVNILVDGCEAYRYGRHGFAVIDGSNVTFNNCYCAYPAPNIHSGQSGYVSFGNTGPALSETSTYINCVAEHMADTVNGRGDFEYEGFTDHGGSLQSVTVNNFQAIDRGGDGTGDNCTFDGASGAAVTVNGGTCYSAQVITLGPNVHVNGMAITGPYASMDISGNNNLIENCLVAGTNNAPPYNSAVWIRGDSNIFRFNTIVTDPSSGNGFSALCLAGQGGSFGTNAQVYGNILLANQLTVNTATNSNSFSAPNVRDNVYNNGATFQFNYNPPVWNLAQWQAQGYDAGSIQVSNPDAALFTNEAGGDLSLKAGSAAIDLVPTSVSHPATDILGNSRPHGPADDAGAYEYGGVVSSVPVITSPGTASGTVGAPFSYQITGTNSPTSFSATGLPAGLSVNGSTGQISGTPTTAGTYSATINAANTAGPGSAALSISIGAAAPSPPVISSAASATGTVGTVFSYQITATNSPTGFNASGLPAGLSVNPTTGVISGTPTAAGSSTVTLTATNAGGNGTAILTLTINPAAAVESPYGGTPWPIPGKVEAENYDLGGEGLAYHDNDPQNLGGGYRNDGVDIRAISTDAGGGYQVGWTNQGEYLNYTVNVTAGGSYQFQLRVAGSGGGTIHFNVDGANVTGPMAFSGTGSYDSFTTVSSGAVTLTAGKHIIELYEDADNGYDINWFAVVAAAPPAPAITSPATATGTVGTPFSYQITATNSPTSFGASGLPAGLLVNTATGLISGTPTAAGSSTVTLSATNAGGTGTATLALTITQPAVPEAPYGGTAWAVPGQIEAENYDLGGEGVAYHDNDPQNLGGGYRNDGVDIRAIASDAGGGYQVGWTNQGEYLNYTVNVTAGGSYQFQLRVAGSGGGTIHFNVDGANVTGPMAFSGTGSYDSFTTVSSAAVTLTAGKHIIELYEDADTGYDINWFAVVAAVPPAPAITSPATATATVGAPFSYPITATNSPTSFNASGLPAGLTVNTTSGVISGTPTAAGTSSVTLTATNAGGTGTATLALTISAAVALPYNVWALWNPGSTTTNGGADRDGNAYNASLVGKTITYAGTTLTLGPANAADAWSSVTVPLPAGNYTTLNMLGAAIGGIVTNQPFVVTYTDGTTQTFSQNLSDWGNVQGFTGETVLNSQTTRLTPTGTSAATPTFIYGYTFTLSGKPVKSITLPANRQVIAFGFTTGSAGPSKPVLSSAASASGTVGSVFSYQITATNTPTSFNASGLPAGLSVNTATGLISGTPTAAGSSTVTLSATNASGIGTAALALAVSAAIPYNVWAFWTPGTPTTNGGADRDGNAYNASLVGSSLTYDGITFTLAAANVADAWNSVTVPLPSGTYTKLDMIGTSVGGTVVNQVFVVNYADGTTQTFTQNLSDWVSSQGYAGETVINSEPTHLTSTGAVANISTIIYGYTFALNGKSVTSITLPNTRQVLAFGFAGHN